MDYGEGAAEDVFGCGPGREAVDTASGGGGILPVGGVGSPQEATARRVYQDSAADQGRPYCESSWNVEGQLRGEAAQAKRDGEDCC